MNDSQNDSKALIPAQPQTDAQFEFLKRLVLDAVQSPHSKASYNTALTAFFEWVRHTWRGPLIKACVAAYRSHLQEKGLAPSTINTRIAAIKKLAAEGADNFVWPFEIAFTIGKVKRVPHRGVRKGLWLTKDRAGELLRLPDTTTLLGKRDYALLCVFLGCGLRREEIRRLTFAHVQMCDGRWCVVDIVGKGNRIRTVPMPEWAKTAIDDYAGAAEIETKGFVFRRVREWKHLGDRPLTTEAIWHVVRKAGLRMDMRLRPHDLRRSFAMLALAGNASLRQIQLSLGHSNISTTSLYLSCEQDMQDAPCDHLGINPLADSPVKRTGKVVRERRRQKQETPAGGSNA